MVLADNVDGGDDLDLIVSTMNGNVFCFSTPAPYHPLKVTSVWNRIHVMLMNWLLIFDKTRSNLCDNINYLIYEICSLGHPKHREEMFSHLVREGKVYIFLHHLGVTVMKGGKASGCSSILLMSIGYLLVAMDPIM